MKKLLLPILLAVLGVAGGTGAGLALKPKPDPEAMAMEKDGNCPEAAHKDADAADGHDENHASEDADPEGMDYVKLNNQFIVPVVTGDLVDSLVVVSLSVEIELGQREMVYSREPKLRDALLQVMFDHANMGGFAGNFTDGNTLDILRAALTETARGILGHSVNKILIVDIARQDI